MGDQGWLYWKLKVERVTSMGIALNSDIKGWLGRRNFAHLATVLPDGAPLSTPVWVGREGDFIIICTEERSLKSRNTRRDPRVAISIVDGHDPYAQAQLRGRVVEWRQDSGFNYLDAMSNKYVGKGYPYREEVPVALVIELEKARYRKEPLEHTQAASA
jgi:PPOX class probable F420-dependent enzyme